MLDQYDLDGDTICRDALADAIERAAITAANEAVNVARREALAEVETAMGVLRGES